jgi:hypothetical protein
LVVDRLKSALLSCFHLLVKLHDTEQAHQADNSDDACHTARTSGLRNVCGASVLQRVVVSQGVHQWEPDPATVGNHGQGGDDVQPEKEAHEVPIKCDTSQNYLEGVSNHCDQSDEVETVVGGLGEAQDTDVVEEESVNGDHGHHDLSDRMIQEPCELHFPNRLSLWHVVILGVIDFDKVEGALLGELISCAALELSFRQIILRLLVLVKQDRFLFVRPPRDFRLAEIDGSVALF